MVESGRGETAQPGLRGKNVLALIRDALKCPDQSPS